MKKNRRSFLTFSAISLLLLVAGCSLLPNTSLEILQYSLEKGIVDGELTAQIEGVAHNDGGAKLEYAEIEGNFYDKQGTLLATGYAKTMSPGGESFTLDPGQIWEFTILSPVSLSEPAYPSLKVLQCSLEKNSTEAKLVGRAQNDGNVTLAFVKLTGHFYDRNGNPIIPTGTSSTMDLQVGVIWEFIIYFPSADVDKPEGGYAQIENPDTDLQAAETPSMAEQVDYVDARVGALRGSTIMP